jgi:hypothetical protein
MHVLCDAFPKMTSTLIRKAVSKTKENKFRIEESI